VDDARGAREGSNSGRCQARSTLDGFKVARQRARAPQLAADGRVPVDACAKIMEVLCFASLEH
jgi:hypothetical protein